MPEKPKKQPDPSGPRKAKPPKLRSPVGRKRGRPKNSERPIGPAELVLIARQHLRHRPNAEIALALGVSERAVEHHLNTTIKPSWRYTLARTQEQELARIDEVERIAWERFEASLAPTTREVVKEVLAKGGTEPQIVERVLTKIDRNGETAWVNVIQWCVEERCKIKGHYAAQRLQINQTTDIRVAGKSREDIDRELMERVAFVIQNREERERLARSYGSEN